MGKRGASGRGSANGKRADDAFVIRDVQTLKALADPLRHEILALLDSPRAVRELAEHLGRPPDRLYYHLRLLEQHGLIVAIEERGKERHYKLVAETIQIDPDLTMPPGIAAGLVGSILQRAHREYALATKLPKHAGKKRSTIGLLHVRISEAERAALAQRMRELLQEYEAKDTEGEETIGILVGLWPVADPARGKPDR